MGFKNKNPNQLGRNLVPKVGVEPTWAEAHYALNVARLPIPPLRHPRYFTFKHTFVNLTLLYTHNTQENQIDTPYMIL